jgi:hypothetical protein
VVNFLRVIYALIPVGIFLLYTMAPDMAGEIKGHVDKVQGVEGWVVINKPDQKTVGEGFGAMIKTVAPDPGPSVEFYIGTISRDTDRIVYFFQDNWVWVTGGFVFLIGLVIVLMSKSVK